MDINNDDNDIPSYELIDACFSIRILNTNKNSNELLSYLPDLLENQTLWLSQNSCLYKLGYGEHILKDYDGIEIKDEKELYNYFKMVANQPFRNQMMYESNFLSENEIKLSSKILGCEFNLYFKKDKELLLAAETLLAFFESFLATSLKDVYPSAESIKMELIKNTNVEYFNFFNKKSSNEYSIEINNFNFSKESRDGIWTAMLNLIGQLLSKNFFINKPKEYLENLFKNEDLNERLSLIFEHRTFVINILGENPKLFFDDWIKSENQKKEAIENKIPKPFEIKINKEKLNDNYKKFNPEVIGHNKRKVFSIIDINLWNKAKWNGFGFLSNSVELIIFIGYENGKIGNQIFDDWIKRVGRDDKDELIKLSIIKGVDKNNPFWYRVHISNNIDLDSFQSANLFISTSRFHEMNANNPNNLDKLINDYNRFKIYKFCPAKISDNGKKIEPYFDNLISKRNLYVRNAWENGENDFDRMVIKKGDTPIIPNDIEDAPILKLI